ncbi:endonuclease/exonuclease/phosphatase family protein [Synoicihabitans lomoniglobus]|uniref:Endonuclease/exonuclease/phosphatase family protein n=1 Tax=Synoicihabitans lomoniglobus TaxID=2909285 RepID=A0AAF0CMV9_9BACT|nr:endonuclease/exonuclease/phosphatase family protein [Opitutaceae bacterium LMO-M01]WED64698.1 endonuclease/exonuclease/phosphatase family protein [Opitutaceae bacterium LMO-M01]
MLFRLHARFRHWRRRLSRSEWFVRWFNLEADTGSDHAPGLLMIQIDGLSRQELERALNHQRLPWLRRLLRKQGYRVHDFYSGLPASTPAVQGELHYGVRTAVPTFSFLDRRSGRIDMMMQPSAAKRIEADLAEQAEGLLKGGSSWSNVYTGGADQKESHFCGASIGIGDTLRSTQWRKLLLFALLHVGSILRLLALLPVELVLALVDAGRGIVARRQSWMREIIFVFARVLVCVGLRELITLGTKIDLARGLPIIHVNFLGYDEQSHRRGPSSLFAHWTLKGIDRAIGILHRSARRSRRRDYEVWIFSDHGQIRATPFGRVVDGGLEGVVGRHMPHATGSSSPQKSAAAPSWSSSHAPRWRDRAEGPDDKVTSAFGDEPFALAAMGPVGNIYLAEPLPPERIRHLATNLIADGVPGVLLRRDDGKVDWITSTGEFVLPDHTDQLPHAESRRATIAEDLTRLAHNEHAGDLIALGWDCDGTSYTFADENGSHAGCSPQETHPFLLLPGHVRLPTGPAPFRPADLRRLALTHLGRHDAVTASPPATSSAERLRVVSYNAHACLGLDGRCSPHRIARVLADCDADVIALQELDCGRARSREEDQLQVIADQLGFHATFCPAVSGPQGHYGHGLLTRFPIIESRYGELPGWGRLEPRAALMARLDWHGRPVTVVSTHLGLTRTERLQQVDTLLGDEWLGATAEDEPVLFCGDLNTSPGSIPYRRLASRLHDVQAHCPDHVSQATFPSFLPVRCLDHIFVSPHFNIEDVDVGQGELPRLSSDHLPLIATLALPTDSAAASAPAENTSPAMAQHA